jgi:predicted Zn finger-like uncharacterized protein
MPVTLTCPECSSTLRVRDDLAGKKVKCPRCGHHLLVPVRAEEVTEVLNAPDEAITEVQPSGPAPRKAPRRPRDEEEDEDDRRVRSKPKPKAKPKARRRRDEDEDEDEEDRRVKYKPCPSCGARGPRRVTWTAWGSFYGPAMLSHVKCQDCGHEYNGRTGRSNILGIIVFVAVPLLGILAVLGVIAYIFYRQGYFG